MILQILNYQYLTVGNEVILLMSSDSLRFEIFTGSIQSFRK
ncbi:hypothetical protein [Pedobacter jejuensis]|nr:hypothetical protein [Pedobacter jejuensis]